MPVFGCASLPVQGRPLVLLGRGVEDEKEEPPEPAARQEPVLPAPRRWNEQPAVSPSEDLLDELEAESAEGLSLEAAIERLLSANVELAAKYQDIPKARADVLTAGLRNDPVVFLTASPVPYQNFSPQRPGATTYDVTLVQPLDLSGKHKTNKHVAEKHISILEARYQDAVRLEIDRLFAAYVNLLEARATTNAARANLKRLSEAAEKCSEQVRQGRRPQTDRTRAFIRKTRARLALQRAEASLLHARRNLSVLLALPVEEADRVRLRGSLRDQAPSPPDTPELIEIARRVRPDLLALQRSIARARAEVRREQTQAVDDFFLFFSPYQVLDSTPQGKKIADTWQVGLMVPIPALNRNQGEIRRARVEVAQWRIEVERAEEEIIDEVRLAATEYAVSRQVVEQYERDILANVSRLREEKYRRFAEEEKELAPFLAAQRDYDETVRAYVEALARHRRAMLGLNTAVGQRILP